MKTILILCLLAVSCGVATASMEKRFDPGKPCCLVPVEDVLNQPERQEHADTIWGDASGSFEIFKYIRTNVWTFYGHKWRDGSGSNIVTATFHQELYQFDEYGNWTTNDMRFLDYVDTNIDYRSPYTPPVPKSFYAYYDVTTNGSSVLPSTNSVQQRIESRGYVVDQYQEYYHWKLMSGDRGIVDSQVLHELCGYADHNNNTPWQAPDYHRLPAKALRVGKDTLHDDPNFSGNLNGAPYGTLYLVANAGTESEIEVSVDHDNSYRYQINDRPYPLHVLARGGDANHDLTTESNVEFCVGQQVSFGTTWNSLPPNVVNVPWVHWHLPGDRVNDAWRLTDRWGHLYGSLRYRNNPDLLTNWVTTCWYIRDIPDSLCSIGISLDMSNGQHVNINAAGQFRVYRPSWSGFDKAPVFQCGMICNSSTGIRQLFGNMNWRIQVDSRYGGHTAVTQLIKASGVLWKNTAGDYYLDGDSEIYGLDQPDDYSTEEGKPYNVSDFSTHPIGLVDNPQTIWLPYVEMYGDFQDYLRFKPAGDGSIWVSLAMITWHAYGYADAVSGIEITNLPPADDPIDTDAFPVWDYNVPIGL